MAPVLFTIGPFNAYSFGIFTAISFIIATFIIFKYSKEELKEEEYLDAFLYTSIASLITARIAYILLNFNQFGANILRYFVVREAPGLSFSAGMLGGFVYLYWYAKKKKLDFVHLVDLFSVAGSLGLFFAKAGEQLGGAAFGKETTFLLGVKIVGLPGRHHPTEAYEGILYLVIFIILSYLFQRGIRQKWPYGLIGVIFGQSMALVVFLIEFLKVNTLYLYRLSLNQIIAIIVFILLIKPLFNFIKIIKYSKKI